MNKTPMNYESMAHSESDSTKPTDHSSNRQVSRIPRTAGGAVFKMLWGSLGFLAGLLMLAFFALLAIGPFAIAPIIIFLAVSIMAGRREARGQKLGWGYALCLILFTGALPGFVGTAGVTMFMQGEAFFRDHAKKSDPADFRNSTHQDRRAGEDK